MLMVSHDWKVHIAPHFNHIELKAAVVALTMPFVYHDDSAGTKGITSPKRLCCTLFWLCWSKECSVAIGNAISIIQYWCQCQWCHMIRAFVAPHFNCFELRNAMVSLMMLLASCDSDVRASCITWPKSHVASDLIILT